MLKPSAIEDLRGAGANFGVATQIEYRLHPVATVFGGPLIHPLTPDDLRVRQAYGENYRRLKDLKKQYDPTNLFRQNSNMRPD